MAKVRGEFPEYSSYKNKGMFSLTCDKSMNPYTWAPPIVWTGTVCGVSVKFTQISSGVIDRTDFDFTGFPEKYDSAIGYIIEAIDDAMKVMD